MLLKASKYFQNLYIIRNLNKKSTELTKLDSVREKWKISSLNIINITNGSCAFFAATEKWSVIKITLFFQLHRGILKHLYNNNNIQYTICIIYIILSNLRWRMKIIAARRRFIDCCYTDYYIIWIVYKPRLLLPNSYNLRWAKRSKTCQIFMFSIQKKIKTIFV